jgi:hypothetical protein
LTVRVLDGRVPIYRDFSTDDHQLEGGEILSINGVSAKQILRVMMTIHTGEDRSRTAAHIGSGTTGILTSTFTASPNLRVCSRLSIGIRTGNAVSPP